MPDIRSFFSQSPAKKRPRDDSGSGAAPAPAAASATTKKATTTASIFLAPPKSAAASSSSSSAPTDNAAPLRDPERIVIWNANGLMARVKLNLPEVLVSKLVAIAVLLALCQE